MEQTIQMLCVVIQNLRNLFSNKDRLVGVDDWDSFIGCLIALENIGVTLQKLANEEDKETLKKE